MGTSVSGSMALAQLSQQMTAALANVTINFSIWKSESAAEYQPLRNALTPMRKQAAEAGNLHIIACKLGALFAPILPKFPSLYKAYGVRASAIVTSSRVNSTTSVPLGPFSQYVGVDGTSILAAATVGEAAIAAHLLACMLAKQFRAENATAAWEELVAERKARVFAEYPGSVPLETSVAARMDITTQELATWDASARAWLAEAGLVEGKRQKQLMLILENVRGVITASTSTYGTIVSAWCEALSVMEEVVQGAAHAVQSGSLLLAVSAWHIYPNITCLGNETVNLDFNDEVVTAGGNLTVGLLSKSPDAPQAGVHWSLSLARLRYYGDVEKTVSVVNIDSSTVAPEDFLIIALGAVTCYWAPKGTSLEESCKLFNFLDVYAQQQCAELRKPWTELFSETARRISLLESYNRQYATTLFKLGQRNKALFASDHKCGLFDQDPASTTEMMQLFETCDGIRAKVSLLKLAINQRFPAEKSLFCIVSKTNNELERNVEFSIGEDIYQPQIVYQQYLFGTLDRQEYVQQHVWHSLPASKKRIQGGYMVRIPLNQSSGAQETHERFIWVDPPFRTKSDGESQDKRIIHCAAPGSNDSGSTVPADFYFEIFQRIYGDNDAAIYCTKWWKLEVPREMWLLDDLQLAMEEGWIQSVKLLSLMRAHIDVVKDFAATFDALKEMPRMQISLLHALDGPFRRHERASRALPSWEEHSKTRSQQNYLKRCFEIPEIATTEIFAAIASLSAGVHDLSPSHLADVMAISHENSLFVVDALIRDPYHTGNKIVEICGNVGKPGLALLIPPKHPKIGPSDRSRFEHVKYLDFDGKMHDNFAGTDMSIWFTNYERPVQQSTTSGSKFIQAFFLEAVVSVYDKGRWIADLDIVKHKQAFSRLDMAARSTNAPVLRVRDNTQVVALDNWDEIIAIEDDQAKCIARAGKNWLARLAIATTLQQKGLKLVLLPPEDALDFDSIISTYATPGTQGEVSSRFTRTMSSSKETIVFL